MKRMRLTVEFTLLVLGGAPIHFLMVLSIDVMRVLCRANDWFIDQFKELAEDRERREKLTQSSAP